MEKVLVANRGEIALRVLEACREEGLSAVAVFSEPERGALHVREASEAVCIGPADPARSYLSIPALMAACEVTGADALHPGYGFLSESADLAEVCQAHGITFVGPPPEVLRLCGDKIRAKERVARAGVPVLPGSPAVSSPEEAVHWAEKLGYPLLLKAAAGGGGRGIRVVGSPEELVALLPRAREEARLAFGDGSLFLERYVPSPRHVEVQILADAHGGVVHWGTRDCTVQRRHQKLVEEAPAPGLPPPLRERLQRAAVEAARALGYVGVGTIEFLVEGEDFYFIEVNARIQVEHPVSEALVGRNLVREQLRIARGDPLGYRQEQVELWGHAIECRVNAEDPARGFLPSSGRLFIECLPGGVGVRVDSAIFQGMEVLPFYDPLLAKVITHGETREEARVRMYSALRRFRVRGVTTNRDLLLEVIAHPDFASGRLSTDFLERLAEAT
ncbi:MAG: Acetyl-CoA carboxylase biotin carboxylase [Acetothermia bacterium 64_32]|nr:MAG: Acetyl-CoA carboxylase biotin carboxylase [Acetothermia bacterium 64_32]HAF71555.1 acetyl-CoA carboxylase biotin carboxylase subunit [Candidatus Acetothermia bacterium]